MQWKFSNVEPAAFQVSDNLRNDPEIVLAAVNQNGRALQHASGKLQNDREIVVAAVNQDRRALDYASAELRNGPEIVRKSPTFPKNTIRKS